MWAGLSSDEHNLLDAYATKNPDENSRYKGIPISKLDAVRATLKKTGYKFRVKFRGPRYDWHRGTCLKSNAKTFAIYDK